jgi:hypothetical protein
MLFMKANRFIFWVLPIVALSLTLFFGRSETAPSVTEVTELIKARINRMTSVLVAREAETEAYRESQSFITNVSTNQKHRTPAEIEEALFARCEKQLANLTITSVSVGQPGVTEFGDDNRKAKFWPVEFQVLNPTDPTQNLHAVMFCYRDSQGEWIAKVTKLDSIQNGTVCAIPKYAFREMGLE